jgi:hypothetical protein
MERQPPPTEPRRMTVEADGPMGLVKWWGILAIAATALVTLPIAWAAMFDYYAYYDDEGSLLVLFRQWAHLGGLYTRVFTRYGPAPMFFFGLPERMLGAQFDFTSGRIVTLVLWIATSVVLGLSVLVISRRIVAAVLTQVVSFFLLQSFQAEPMHPGQFVQFLFALMVLVIAAVRPRRPALADALLGIIMATILMTEVNLGVFALVALVYVFSISTILSIRSVLRPLSEAGLVALGPVLVLLGPATSASGLTARWAVKYAIVYAAAALIVVLVCRLRHVETVSSFDRGAIVRFVGWFVGTIVFFAGFSVVTGTRPGDFVQGVFLAPLTQSKSFLLPVDISGAAVWWLIAPVALLVGFRWLKQHTDGGAPRPGSMLCLVGGAVRIIAGVVAIVAISRNTSSALAFLPLVGVCLLPPASSSSGPATSNARLFLVALALTESMHAFPVAGSQVSWSLMLVVPCVVLTFQDGWREIAQWQPLRALRHVGFPVAALLLALVFVQWPNAGYLTAARDTRIYYKLGEPLDLPGTSDMRLSAPQVTQLRSVSAAIRKTCSQFVSVPGYGGLYVFTGIAPPNGINATVWMYLFTRAQQQSVVNVLERTRGPVCLVERSGLALGVSNTKGVPPLVGASINWRTWPWVQPIPPGPLVRYLSSGFVPRVVLPPYMILVHKT